MSISVLIMSHEDKFHNEFPSVLQGISCWQIHSAWIMSSCCAANPFPALAVERKRFQLHERSRWDDMRIFFFESSEFDEEREMETRDVWSWNSIMSSSSPARSLSPKLLCLLPSDDNEYTNPNPSCKFTSTRNGRRQVEDKVKWSFSYCERSNWMSKSEAQVNLNMKFKTRDKFHIHQEEWTDVRGDGGRVRVVLRWITWSEGGGEIGEKLQHQQQLQWQPHGYLRWLRQTSDQLCRFCSN